MSKIYMNQNGELIELPFLSNQADTLAADGSISREGANSGFYKGRDNAMIKQTSQADGGGYSPMLSVKTTDGSWDIGPRDSNQLYFVYVSDTDYNAKVANSSTQIIFSPDGGINGKTLLNWSWPIDSVYFSYSSVSPAIIFGGSWTQITDKFVRMANNTESGGSDVVGAHAHTLGNAYGKISIQNNGATHYQYKENVTLWTSNYATSGTGTGSAGLAGLSNDDGMIIGGTTDSNGNYSNMPVYQNLYAWRRTA